MKRLIKFVVTAVMLSLATSTSANETTASRTLKIGSLGAVASLDPHLLNETFTIGVLSNVYEGLVRRDGNLVLGPGLARRWEKLAPRRWRFHLRDGVKFHDGRPFGAADVVYSFNRLADRRFAQSIRVPIGLKVQTVNKQTVDFEFPISTPQPFADWEAVLIVPAPSPGSKPADWTSLANGTGPYKILGHRADTVTHFEINRAWWGWGENERQGFDRVSLHPITNAQGRVAALLSGDVDLITPAPVQDLDHLQSAAGLRVVTGPELRTIFFNMDQMRSTVLDDRSGRPNPFRDVRVRRAVAHAIDVDAVRRVVMRGRSTVSASLISPLVHPEISTIKRREFDPAAARRLLAQAGYPNGFATTMDCPSDRYVNDAAICTATVGMLARVGIKVSLNTQTKSKFFAKVLSGGGYASSFSLIGWTPGALDGLNVLDNVVRCRDAAGNGGRFNLGGYCNSKVDMLSNRARVEFDSVRRRRLITRAFEIVHADAGFVPLHQQMTAWAMADGVNAHIRADNQLRFDLISPANARSPVHQVSQAKPVTDTR